MAHAPESDDEMDAEEEGDGVVAFGHVLLNIPLKSLNYNYNNCSFNNVVIKVLRL